MFHFFIIGYDSYTYDWALRILKIWKYTHISKMRILLSTPKAMKMALQTIQCYQCHITYPICKTLQMHNHAIFYHSCMFVWFKFN
jgi:hypothetical protein